MGRIDIVIFPNGGKEIFGQIKTASSVALSGAVDCFVKSKSNLAKPAKIYRVL